MDDSVAVEGSVTVVVDLSSDGMGCPLGRPSDGAALLASAGGLGGSEVFGEPPLRAVKADMVRHDTSPTRV